MRVNKIVVLGGGSAGWMVASTLIKAFPKKEIVVISSETIPTVGVGESTLSDINRWLDYLDLDPEHFLSECDGAYKLAIGFTNFAKKDSDTFFYPFGDFNVEGNLFGLTDWHIRKALDESLSLQDYVLSYFPQAHMFKDNKVIDKTIKELWPFKKEKDTAYQIDAGKFGWYLKNRYAIPRGVTHINKEVTRVNQSELGVESLTLASGDIIYADLFIDCTGFKSMLLGEALGVKFISTKHILPNNKAWASPITYSDKEKELEVYTNCTAIENGWVWNTPLWSRIGSGYVYSDEFIDDESALNQFKAHLDSKSMKVYNPNRSKDMNFRQVFIKNGYYEKSWVKNVCAFGLASGFLEPLESTGLWFIYSQALYLVDILVKENITQFDRDIYNSMCSKDYKLTSEFVALHYALSSRDDTPYWKQISEKEFDQNMLYNYFNLENNDGFSGFVNMYRHKKHYPGYGISSIAVGMGYTLFNKRMLKEKEHLYQVNHSNDFQNSFKSMNDKQEQWKKIAKNMPTHYEYLRKNYYESI